MDVVNERIQFSWSVWINWISILQLFSLILDKITWKLNVILFIFSSIILFYFHFHTITVWDVSVTWIDVRECCQVLKCRDGGASDSLNSVIIVGMLRWLSSIVCVGQTCANTCPDTRVTVNIVFTRSHIHISNTIIGAGFPPVGVNSAHRCIKLTLKYSFWYLFKSLIWPIFFRHEYLQWMIVDR